MQRVLERAHGGERRAQAELVEDLHPRIEKMALYFGHRCGVDADDLRQEAWIAILEMLPRLDLSVGTPEQHLLKRAKWRILDSIITLLQWQPTRQKFFIRCTHCRRKVHLCP